MKKSIIIRTIFSGLTVCSLFLYFRDVKRFLPCPYFDDSYMFLRYAKNWLAGMGFAWNSDDGPIHGLTSVTHLFAVTIVRGLTDISDPRVLTSISFSAGLVSIAVMIIIGFVFFKNLRKYWTPLLIIPCILWGNLFSFHSTTGMETTSALLYNSIFAGAICFLVKKRSFISFSLCLAAAYISFLTRPDNGLYCILLPPLFLIADDVRYWKHGVIYISAFTIILCIDLLFKKIIFGDFLPLSFYAKSAGFYCGYLGGHMWNAAHETFIFFRESLPFLMVCCFIPNRDKRRLAAILLPMFLTFCYLATVTQIMGRQARYYYVSLPYLILGAYIAADSFSDKYSVSTFKNFNFPWKGAVACISLLILLTSSSVKDTVSQAWLKWVIGEPTHYTAKQQFTTRAMEQLEHPEWWWNTLENVDTLISRLPPEATVSASEVGYIGSRNSDKQIIDVVGLHDRHIAHHGFSAEYLFSRLPDVIWFPHSDYTYALKEILDSKAFIDNYEYYPNVYIYGIAILKNTHFTVNIRRILEKEFSRIYPGRILSDYKAEPVNALDG